MVSSPLAATGTAAWSAGSPTAAENNASSAFSVDADNEYYKSVDYSLLSKDGKTLIAPALIEADGSYVVPSGVEEIEMYAFYNNSSLTSVTLPDGC